MTSAAEPADPFDTCEVWELTCELLCCQMPQDLALLVLGYYGLSKKCSWYWAGIDDHLPYHYFPSTEWWVCSQCGRAESCFYGGG